MKDISMKKQRAGRIVSTAIIVSLVLIGLFVLRVTNVDPRTDDANVVANYIGIAPEVEGRITSLPVRDNEAVAKGALLYEIDPQPYQYRLQEAISARDNLEQQIIDEKRRIGSQRLGVQIAEKGTESSVHTTSSQQAAANAAETEIPSQEATVSAAEAQAALAAHNLARAEPLLAQHFITEQQIDQLRTASRNANEELVRARSTLAEMHSRFQQAQAQVLQAKAAGKQQELREQQSTLDIDRLETLESQKLAKEAAVRLATYDLERCKVFAPFNARVTNLHISVGQYVKPGTQVFALIDTTAWWVLGNYKETQLRHLAPGMPADIYILTQPNVRLRGVVESVGYGVSLEDVTQGQNGDLPVTTRTLNWVRLAQRFPVRIRMLDSAPDLYRLGASATVIVRSRATPLSVPKDPNETNTALYGSPDANSQSTGH